MVGCDGINSSVRKLVFGPKKTSYAGYSSWRFVAHNISHVDYGIMTEMWGKGKRFGIVPLSKNRVHCFASLNSKRNSLVNHAISIGAFQKLFEDFGGAVPGLINSLKHCGELIYNDLEDVHIEKCFLGRVILIGDAARG